MPTPLSPTHEALGAAIRELRLERGMTQAQLAEASGVHDRWVTSAERGLVNVTVRSLSRLVAGLDTTWAEFGARIDRHLG